MDGISRVAGVGPTVELGGRTFTVRARILRHFAELEAEQLKRQGTPFEMIRLMAEAMKEGNMPLEIMLAAVGKAFELAQSWKFIPIEKTYDFIDRTIPGRCMAVWLAIRDSAEGLTLKEASDLYCDEYERILHSGGWEKAEKWSDTLLGYITQASGEDELGNSTGSPTSEQAASTEASPGTTSTDSSPKDATGNPTASAT